MLLSEFHGGGGSIYKINVWEAAVLSENQIDVYTYTHGLAVSALVLGKLYPRLWLSLSLVPAF